MTTLQNEKIIVYVKKIEMVGVIFPISKEFKKNAQKRKNRVFIHDYSKTIKKKSKWSGIFSLSKRVKKNNNLRHENEKTQNSHDYSKSVKKGLKKMYRVYFFQFKRVRKKPRGEKAQRILLWLQYSKTIKKKGLKKKLIGDIFPISKELKQNSEAKQQNYRTFMSSPKPWKNKEFKI